MSGSRRKEGPDRIDARGRAKSRPPVFSIPSQSGAIPSQSGAIPSQSGAIPSRSGAATPPDGARGPAIEPSAALLVVRWEIGLPARSHVRVTLHDGGGQQVDTLFEGVLDAGVHHCEAGVSSATMDRIGPLGYIRMELPGRRWQQSAFVPER